MKKTLITAMMIAAAASSSAQTPTGTSRKEASDTPGVTEKLGEVIVTAKNAVVTPDKTILYVGNNIKRHAYDGYSALSLMAVPGLDVDAIDGSVSTHGKGVLLCINGLEATKDEIQTLNPKDIRRIDYYTNFDPNHPTADYVIDFIMKIRDYGGAVMLQADHSLNRLTGGGVADWKMYQKKSEFGIRVASGYDHYEPDRNTTSVRSLQFGQDIVTRQQESKPSSVCGGNANAKLSYMHRYDNGTLKAAASLRSTHDIKRERSLLNYSTTPTVDYDAYTATHSDRLVPSFTASYDHKFKNKATFRASVSGSYTHTNSARDYAGADTYLSFTKENYHSISPGLNFTLPLGKKMSIYANAAYYYNHSSMTYIENGQLTPSRLINGQGIFETGANFKITDRLRATMRLQERVMTTDPGSGSNTDTYFTPAIRLAYTLNEDIRIDGAYNMGILNPSLSYYTTDVKHIDEYMLRTGNPDLRIQRIHGGTFSITGHKRWGEYQLYTEYMNVPRAIYDTYTCNDEQKTYTQSFLNGGNAEKAIINASIQPKIIPGKLKLTIAMQYNYTKCRTFKLIDENTLIFTGGLKFTSNGFMADAKFVSPYRTLDYNGTYLRTGPRLDISAGYTYNGWSFNLITKNPFMRTHSSTTVSYPGVYEVTKKYNPFVSYNYFALRVSYRFNYGKKHKFKEVQINDKGGSAILSH